MIPPDHPDEDSEYPFGFTAADYRQHLQTIPDRDVLDDLDRLDRNAADLAAIAEEQQRFILEYADDDTPGGNRAVAEVLLADTLRRLEAARAERARRESLYRQSTGHPLARQLPAVDESFANRIAAVKAAWPIEKFVRVVLGADLTPAGPGKWVCRCPLEGHDDRTPSFSILERAGQARCFGCRRGGDILDLAAFAFGLERMTDQLAQLERLAGIEKRGRS